MGDTVRMRFTISGEYDAPMNEEAYGTIDPQEMAEVDQRELEQDVRLFLSEATDFKVEVVQGG